MLTLNLGTESAQTTQDKLRFTVNVVQVPVNAVHLQKDG